MSQRVLDILSSRGAYRSHEAAHAAGWHWNARPNKGQSSHTQEWWPPQEVVPDGVKLPLWTMAVLNLIDEIF